MKLLANGCSMTHGQELVTDGYDPANTQLCYAKKIFDEYEILEDLIKISCTDRFFGNSLISEI